MGETLMANTRSAKRVKWLKRLAVVLFIYTIVGFFVVPAIIKWQMLKRLPALTKRQVEVKQVKFNPYALSLTIRGFALKETNGDPFISFDEFYLNFQPWASLFHWGIVFSDISLTKPFAQVNYLKDGSFNFANLIDTNAPPPAKSPTQPGPPPKIKIYHLSVSNAMGAFADLKHNPQFHAEFTPIDLNLTNLTTVRNDNSPYTFFAKTGAGETFAWEGIVGVMPPRSSGRFRLGGLQPGSYSVYSHDYAKLEIVSGTVDIAADYQLAIGTNGQDIAVSNGAVHVTNLKVKDPSTGEIVAFVPAFSVTNFQASVAKQYAWAGMVKSSGGSFLARRNHDGKINVISQLNLTPKVKEQVNTVVQTVVPWTAGADHILIENYSIHIEDKVPEKPVILDIDQLRLDVKNVSDQPNAKAAMSLSFRVQQTGSVAVDGTATFIPPSADLHLALTNADLRAITPYVSEQVKLLITGGAVDVNGQLHALGNKPGEPMATFTGNMAINKFVTTDDILFKEFSKWDSLNVDGVKLAVQPDKLAIDQVKFTGLKGSILIGPDGRPTVLTIMRKQLGATNSAATNKTTTTAKTAKPAATSPTAGAAAAVKALPDIKLGALVLENASLHFGDESLEPHCDFDVQEFSGSIKGLSSRNPSNAIVDFKGKVDDRSPFSVKGEINPLGTNLFVNVTVNFTNTDLTAFTPYTEKFVGRPLQKGKFSMAVHYLVDGKALKAENYFYIDQLTLGPKNDSTNATKLPVKLAVALLKDRNGRIELNVPIAGKTDDPKLKVGPIIWHVVFNVIEKAALSPFSLLGSMFGGGEEMSFVQFEPGSAVIPASETNKLQTLAKSLYARPTLTLEINGSVDPVMERVPLGRQKLDEQLKSLWIKEQTDSGKQAMAMEDVKLDPKERERLLRKLYKQKIGRYKPSEVSTNANGGLGSAANLLAAMPPPIESDHGSAYLMRPKKETAPQNKLKPTTTLAGKKPTGPVTREELELADMEDQLVERIPISYDDFRELMKARAASVQAYLLKTDKVTADRLFPIAPKPIDKSFKGEAKVNLSLD